MPLGSTGSTVGSAQLRDLFAALESLGANPATLAERVGLPRSISYERNVRFSSSKIVALFDAAAALLHDPLLGLHAGVRVTASGPLFYLLLSTPSVREGLRRLCRFARVAVSTQNMEVAVRGHVIELVIEPGDPDLERSPHAVDYLIGGYAGIFRRAVPGFHLLGVDLTHPEIGEPGAAERVLGCATRFSQPRNALRFPDATLALDPGASNAQDGDDRRQLGVRRGGVVFQGVPPLVGPHADRIPGRA